MTVPAFHSKIINITQVALITNATEFEYFNSQVLREKTVTMIVYGETKVTIGRRHVPIVIDKVVTVPALHGLALTVTNVTHNEQDGTPLQVTAEFRNSSPIEMALVSGA